MIAPGLLYATICCCKFFKKFLDILLLLGFVDHSLDLYQLDLVNRKQASILTNLQSIVFMILSPFIYFSVHVSSFGKMKEI